MRAGTVLSEELVQLELLISAMISKTILEEDTATLTSRAATTTTVASNLASESMMILSADQKNQLLTLTRTIESHLILIICRPHQIWAQLLSHLIK